MENIGFFILQIIVFAAGIYMHQKTLYESEKTIQKSIHDIKFK
jgi:uncharacterized membrane protein